MILKLGMKHQGEELYKAYINHDPRMTMTCKLSSPIHMNREKWEDVI